MQFLDIRHVDPKALSTESAPDGPLPVFMRKKGVFPDQDRMLIGDLVLVSPHAPKAHQTAIRSMQSKRYDEAHAQWTHAAVYIGEGKLCEATTKGVVVSELNELFSDYSVRFRRFQSDDVGHRFKIAIGALREMTKPYDWSRIKEFAKEVVQKVKTSPFKAERTSRPVERTAHICSALYCEAFHFSVGRFPVRSNVYPVSPADLSASNSISDVDLSWLRIPASPTHPKP
jgi:hypothetical protein